MFDFDALVVGCGFSGAVAARILAEEKNMRVRILEKRTHIAGNMYDEPDENGILIHRYGPHVFHTNSEEAFRFIEPYSEWFGYEHRVLGKIRGKLVPIPFNFASIDAEFSSDVAERLKQKLSDAYPGKSKVTVSELCASTDTDLADLGRFVFEYVFKNYTSKQWGTPPETMDSAVIHRVPVVLSYDDRYFQDAIQKMPRKGYTTLFENLLSHPNISVALGCDALRHLRCVPEEEKVYVDGEEFTGPCVYTGLADELFGFRFGALPYRSLYLSFESLPVTSFQKTAVVNYPNEEDFTRITEFKKLTGQKVSGRTTIMKEYPRAYDKRSTEADTPYYAILNDENKSLYSRYFELSKKIPNLLLCGRLAEYAYYNMDAAIDSALKKTREKFL